MSPTVLCGYSGSNYPDGFANAYLLPGSSVQRGNLLLVFLNGSSFTSALGEKGSLWWKSTTLAHPLREQLPKHFDILVPEYFNVEFGRNESVERSVHRHYTLHDRVHTAASVIDCFLRENQYEHVVLMGYSEGALILARVYFSLKQRDQVERLIFLSYGGMSQSQTLRLMQQKYGDMKGALLSNQGAIDEVIVKINTDPLSIDRWWLGWPYLRWSTFGPYEPISDLLAIDIPTLMLHGTQDMQVPVESSRMAAEEFRKAGKPSFKYIEYPGEGHVFHEVFKSVIHDVESWLLREGP